MENIKEFDEHNDTGSGSRVVRDYRLDIIRAVAIIAVVFIHSYENYDMQNRLAYLFGRCGVPLFLMLTGSTMIERSYVTREQLISFAKKVLLIYSVSVLWSFLYRLRVEAYVSYNIRYSLGLVPAEKHLWYLNLLLVVYLTLPFLSYIRQLSTKAILIIWMLLVALNFLQIYTYTDLQNQYLYAYVYLIWGYLCYKRQLFKKVPIIAIIVLLAIFTMISLYLFNNQWFIELNTANNLDIWWYYSLTVMAPSLFVMPCLLKIKGTNIKILEELSKCSFGIYIFHIWIINRYSETMIGISENRWISTIALCIFSLIISFVITFIIRRIPIIKKTVLG